MTWVFSILMLLMSLALIVPWLLRRMPMDARHGQVMERLALRSDPIAGWAEAHDIPLFRVARQLTPEMIAEDGRIRAEVREGLKRWLLTQHRLNMFAFAPEDEVLEAGAAYLDVLEHWQPVDPQGAMAWVWSLRTERRGAAGAVPAAVQGPLRHLEQLCFAAGMAAIDRPTPVPSERIAEIAGRLRLEASDPLESTDLGAAAALEAWIGRVRRILAWTPRSEAAALVKTETGLRG